MSRVIEFRGNRIDNNEFVYGFFVKDPQNKCRIYWKPFDEATSNTYHFVDEKTLCQFTGFYDKNKNKIYEGDQLSICAGYSSTVEFQDGMFVSVYKHPEDGEIIPLFDAIGKDTIVVGDIF